jgi:RimJ/RimL family protein N-acetyltransferase
VDIANCLAHRVGWHTDIRNERSQRAIERLGAQREGVLRAHRVRPDGTLRDTVVYAVTHHRVTDDACEADQPKLR